MCLSVDTFSYFVDKSEYLFPKTTRCFEFLAKFAPFPYAWVASILLYDMLN